MNEYLMMTSHLCMLSKKCMSVDCGVFIDELLLIFSLNVSLPDIFIVFSFFGHTFVPLWIASDRDSNWYRKLQFDMESRVFISQRLCIVIVCD